MTEPNEKQFKDTPWSYTDHMTAREIVNNYAFTEGNLEGLTGLEWKTKSAFHEELPFAGGSQKFPQNPNEEELDKQVMPGWNGYLGKMIQEEGYKEDYQFPIHLVDDHPKYGKAIIDGMHRVAVMYKLHPDQKIRVKRSNMKYVIDNAAANREAQQKRVERIRLDQELKKQEEEGKQQ